MKTNLLPAIRLSLALLVLCAVVYPAAVWALAKLAQGAGQGVQISRNGRVVGYAHVGQRFSKPGYFNTRPSAVGYNAAGSAGSNKGPSNPEYLAQVKARLDTFLLQNPGVRAADVPAELVTASGSGLDPDLSPRAAAVQVARVARARGLAPAQVQALVQAHTEALPLAPARVNVLQLNLALDALPSPTR